MPERQRMQMGETIVTVINVEGHGKDAKVTIRNPYGYEEIVKASQLVPLDETDKLKSYKYAGTE